MTSYLAMAWDARTPQMAATARSIRARLATQTEPWQRLLDRPGQLIAVSPDTQVVRGMIEGAAVFIIGDVFLRDHAQLDLGQTISRCAEFDDLCGELVKAYWGSYVAVQIREAGEMVLFRDPIGMLEGIGWVADGANIYASEGLPWLVTCPPADLAIDWHRVGQLLNDSGTLAETLPLKGVRTLEPGARVKLRQGQCHVRRLWSPHQFLGYDRSKQADARSVRQLVQHCVGQWATRYPDTLVEISGGFDSAVVAAACPDQMRGQMRGVNFFTGQLSGDERRFARKIARSCQIPLDEVFMPVGALSEADFDGLPVDVRPGLNSASLFHDRPLTELAQSCAIKALFTGHGGDAVFFQHPTAMIAADPTFPRWDITACTTLARWSRESVWTVMLYALHLPGAAESHRSATEATAALPFTQEAKAEGSWWTGDTVDLVPAKRVQLAGIASDRGVIAPSWRSRALTVVHPLMSQPLIEMAIETDTYTLTRGRRDRALAREAFADMLPAPVTERMGKGCLAFYFGQCMCASLDFLRAFLLDGLLVHNGVLDRKRLELMLETDYLMRFDCYAKLRSALIMEHWAQVWQQRLKTRHPDAVPSAQA